MKVILFFTEQITVMKNEKISDAEKQTAPNKTPFQKKRNIKNGAPQAEVQRFNADANIGLSKAQVEERIAQGLVNKTGKKYSKSYRSIFMGNICTFFNLLCILAALALLIARAPISQ